MRYLNEDGYWLSLAAYTYDPYLGYQVIDTAAEETTYLNPLARVQLALPNTIKRKDPRFQTNLLDVRGCAIVFFNLRVLWPIFRMAAIFLNQTPSSSPLS